jgi:hypothetical protein
MKAIFKTIILSVIITGILFSLSNCKKDTECEAVITVKLQSDTTVACPNATVEIRKEDVYVMGVTDANGQMRHTFKLEAILDVNAMFPMTTPIVDTLYGQTVIRLKPGETVYKTVFVN